MRTGHRGIRLSVLVIVVVVGTLTLLYLLRVVFLSMMATEGDVPKARDLALPSGSQVAHSDTGCGSGGCWSTFMVKPPTGMTPAELDDQLGSGQEGARISGSFWDPRTINVRTQIVGDLVRVNADYWSSLE